MGVWADVWIIRVAVHRWAVRSWGRPFSGSLLDMKRCMDVHEREDKCWTAAYG